MAENLNCSISGSVCYDSSSANCAKYGRLYNWEAAMNVCPVGWHLPSDAEWTILTDYVGGASTAGTKLKSSVGWNSIGAIDGNGTDDYGFSALPGGRGGSYFDAVGDLGMWWSATESNDNYANGRSMSFRRVDVSVSNGGKSFKHSVRCLLN